MGVRPEDPMVLMEAIYRLRRDKKMLEKRAVSKRARRMLVKQAEEEAVSVPNASRYEIKKVVQSCPPSS